MKENILERTEKFPKKEEKVTKERRIQKKHKTYKRNKTQKGKSERLKKKKKRKITIQATSDLCNKRSVFPCVFLSFSIHLCVCVCV